MIEKSASIRGGFMGLTLAHTKSDVIRAVLEGISLNLGYALDVLKRNMPDLTLSEMLVVGGGAKSPLWRQMLADTYDLPVLKTSIGQDAASLGAAAIAAYGMGALKDYGALDSLHVRQSVSQPDPEHAAGYRESMKHFLRMSDLFAHFAEMKE
jgi:xylulokinase